jgi:hypothetical protein
MVKGNTMDKKAAMAEIKRLRKQAENKDIPQDVRNKSLDKIVEIESMFYDKAVKAEGMAKGGMPKKGMHKMPDGTMMKNSDMKHGGAVKKMSYGGAAMKAKKMAMGGTPMMNNAPMVTPMVNDGPRTPGPRQQGAMAKGGAVKKMAMGGAVTKMSKGGMANCGASVPASNGKKK